MDAEGTDDLRQTQPRDQEFAPQMVAYYKVVSCYLRLLGASHDLRYILIL